jgi:Na+-translocating ferredoxin:NAD+ oxidoreductase RnfG subunit
MRGDTALGVAYFDSHVVRTLREVLMIVVAPEGRIERIEVLRFDEPPEYEVPDNWIAQLEGRRLDDDLSLKGAVVNMTGATLTSEAVVAAARRALAVHEVIRPLESGGGQS